MFLFILDFCLIPIMISSAVFTLFVSVKWWLIQISLREHFKDESSQLEAYEYKPVKAIEAGNAYDGMTKSIADADKRRQAKTQ